MCLDRPQNIEITPYPEDGEDLVVLKGDHLNCSAIGNPVPFFEWFCSEGSMTSGTMVLQWRKYDVRYDGSVAKEV